MGSCSQFSLQFDCAYLASDLYVQLHPLKLSLSENLLSQTYFIIHRAKLALSGDAAQVRLKKTCERVAAARKRSANLRDPIRNYTSTNSPSRRVAGLSLPPSHSLFFVFFIPFFFRHLTRRRFVLPIVALAHIAPLAHMSFRRGCTTLAIAARDTRYYSVRKKLFPRVARERERRFVDSTRLSTVLHGAVLGTQAV